MSTSESRPGGGLGGIRVLELGDLVSAPYASRLLADLGAEVIKVEPPDGDPARRRGPFRPGPEHVDASGLYLALNTGKRSVVVTPGTAADRLAPLLASADIVVTNWSDDRLAAFGVDLDRLHRERPEAVACAITPFGRTGPHHHYQAVDLTVSHGGGWAYQAPGAMSDEERPPLKVFGHQTDYHAAMVAATVCLAAHDKATRTGVGDLIDLSSLAHTAGMLEAALIAASYLDVDPSRLGSRLLNPWKICECLDGLVFVVAVEQDQWERLVALMGTPEWAITGLFDTPQQRLDNEDLLHLYLEEWTRHHTVADLWHRGQAQRICFAPVLTMADMAGQAHLHERGFFVDVDHPAAGTVTHLGAPFLDGAGLRAPVGPAPLLAADAEPRFGTGPAIPSDPRPGLGARSRPLAGVRVLDLSWVWAGPYATMHLGHLGAEVIKVESSLRPGLGRRLALHPPDVEPTLNTCAYFNQWDQGKLSVEVDLASEDGVETVRRLVGSCDVVVQNFATGVMERLGLGYEALRASSPRVIVASISGYGNDGPLRHYMGYGPTTGPLSGLTALTGYPGGPPEELGLSIGDPGAGITAAYAICAALVARGRSGEGCWIDVALWEATASNAVEGWMAHAMGAPPPGRSGNRDPLMSPHGCYRTGPADVAGDEPDPGRWVTIACRSDEEWARLAALIDPELAADDRFATLTDRKGNEDELDDRITAWVAGRDRWEITTELQALGIPAFPSMSPKDLLAYGHLWERGFFERLDHPEVGRRVHTGVPWLMAVAPNGVTSRAPLLGEHTEQVLSSLGGRDGAGVGR
ncbi:MAG: CaiB/BaiF CoA transferase family protein [Acidimicrobiales bacterium]